MPLRKGEQIGQPRHGAVVVHDFADDAGRIESGKAREIDGSLGVAGADQHAAILGDQREDVAGRHDVAVILGRIDGDGDGVGAVMRRDAGRDAFPRLDRDGEGGRMPRPVRARHQRRDAACSARSGVSARQIRPRPKLGHEIDGVGRRHLRRNDEVAFVLALLGVHQDEHAAVARVLEDVVDGRELLVISGLSRTRNGSPCISIAA